MEFGVVFYVWGGLHYKDSIAEYLYNANGSMTKDLNKGITEIKYNQSNLPSQMDIKSPVGEARNTYSIKILFTKMVL